MNDVQFQILDALYFVEPYENILAEVDATQPVVSAELRRMVAKGWVQAMEWDERAGDYVRARFHDSDNLARFHYLATREGLLRHAGQA